MRINFIIDIRLCEKEVHSLPLGLQIFFQEDIVYIRIDEALHFSGKKIALLMGLPVSITDILFGCEVLSKVEALGAVVCICNDKRDFSGL